MPAVHVDKEKVEQCVRESAEYRALCERLVTNGVSYAQSIAPVVTGRYRAGIVGEVVENQYSGGIIGAPSPVIGDTVDYTLDVEFANPRRHKVLLHTLDRLMSEV